LSRHPRESGDPPFCTRARKRRVPDEVRDDGMALTNAFVMKGE